jgi:hypothetical protein
MTIAVAAEIAGVLPLWTWHAAALAVVGLAAIAVACYRRLKPSHALFRAGHVSEIARTLDALTSAPDAPGPTPRVARTSLGLGVSAGQLHHGRAHYALSARDAALSEPDARRLASLILCLRHASASSRLLAGNSGVFHVFIESQP